MRRFVAFLCAVTAIVCLTTFVHGFLPQVPTGKWVGTGLMTESRTGASAVLMPDGRVLIAGGTAPDGSVLTSAEVFNIDGTFSAVPPMNVARTGHAGIWLLDGYVMVTGGKTTGGGFTNTAEVFDPLTDEWHLLPTVMQEPRAGLTATQLPDGGVLIVGGDGPAGPVAALETFSLYTEQFSFAGVLQTGRRDHAASALADGRVLIVGGTDANGKTLPSTEIYDPQKHFVTSGPALATPRAAASATTLLDGRVLIAGGSYPESAQNNIAELNTAEIFDPVAGTITALAAPLTTARAHHQAFLLPDNNSVLLVGGTYAGNALAQAELFTPWTGQFAATGQMSVPRSGAVGSALSEVAGRLVVAGGSEERKAELYGFATVRTDQQEYIPGQKVAIAGNGWQAGETVKLELAQAETGAQFHLIAVADGFGNISNSEYSPQEADLGTHYTLTAIGTSSQAQAKFKDATVLTDISAGAQTPNPIVAGGSATYLITVTRTGKGGITATLSASGLPAGATASFSPATISFTGNNQAPKTSTLTITTTAGMANSTSTITLKAADPAVNSVSDTATLVISSPNSAPAISLQPAPATVTYGNNATFTADATGNPAPTVQWQLSNNSGGTWSAIAGATSKTLTVSGPLVYYNGYQYRAVFTNVAGSATSNAATLTVNPATITVSGITASSKTYDGTNSANFSLAGAVLTGRIGTDNVSVAGGTATFADANVGNGKTVTITGLTLAGTAAGNYQLASTTATATANITAAPLTVTVNDATRIYGAPNPAFTGSLTGVSAGDNITASYSTTATSASAVGNYPITATLNDPGNRLGNYTVTNTPGTLTITKADQTITFAAIAPKTFGDPTFTVTATATSNLPVTFAASGACTATGSAVTLSGAGNCDIVASQSGDGNYNAAPDVAQTIAIGKASPTITVTGGIFTYDRLPHAASATVQGIGGVDLGAAVITYAPGSSAPVNVGSYTATASFAGNGNYSSATSDASVTITPAVANVVLGSLAQVYDGTAHVATATTIPAGVSTSLTYDGGPIAPINAGSYAVIATVTDPNYTGAPVSGTLVVAQAPASVILSNLSQPGDGTPKTPGVLTIPASLPVVLTYTGIDGTTYGPTSIAPSNPGTYSVIATIADSNYSGGTTGTLTIFSSDPGLQLTLLDGMPEPSPYGSRVYFELTTTVSPCPTGTVQLYVDGQPSGSAESLAGWTCATTPFEFQLSDLTPGTHTVNVSYSGDTAYRSQTSNDVTHNVVGSTSVTLSSNMTEVNVGQSVTFTATVTPVALGATPPKGSVEFYDGAALMDTVPLPQAPPFVVTHDATLPAGSHSIRVRYVTADGFYAGSSSSVLVETVDKLTPVIQWASPADITYGTALSAAQLNATATDTGGTPLSGRFDYSPALNTVLNVGQRNLSVTFTPDDQATYAIQHATVTINVTPAMLTITANSTSRMYGMANPILGYTGTGFVNGDTPESVFVNKPSCSTPANASSAVADSPYPITCSGATAVYGNYTLAYVGGQLTLTPGRITVTPRNATRFQGDPNPSLIGDITGIANADPITATYVTTATDDSPAGDYPITVDAVSDAGTGKLANYLVTRNSGVLSIQTSTATQALLPTFTPAPGTYTIVKSVTLVSPTPGATVFYTTDGSAPTISSTPFTAPIPVSTTTTIRAIAGGAGFKTSPTTSGTFTIVAPAPTISPISGSYTVSQSITMSAAAPGVSIYYTTDGSMPTTSSAKYTGPFTVSNSGTIKAIAAGNGYGASTVSTATYTISTQAPTFSPAPSTYNSAQNVSLTSATNGAAIYYTTDGSMPTGASTRYTGPIAVAKTTTIRAVAISTGNTSSFVVTGTYTLVAAAPSFGVTPGTYMVTKSVSLYTPTTGATIYYTTDGSVPTTSSTPYTAPINVAVNTTIKAFTYSPTLGSSMIVTGNYYIMAATPTFSPAPGSYVGVKTVTLSTTSPGTTIYYTTDGTMPTASSTRYTGPITLTATTTVKAITTGGGYTNSLAASGTFTLSPF